MKWSLLGLWMQCLFFSVLTAGTTNAQKVKNVKETDINVRFVNSSLFDVFDYIEHKTNYEFSYDIKDIKEDVVINLRQRYVTVADILYELSKASGLKFRQVDNLINVSPRKQTEDFLIINK